MALSESEWGDISRAGIDSGWLVSAYNSVRIRIDKIDLYYDSQLNCIVFQVDGVERQWVYPPTDEGRAGRNADFAMIDRAMGVGE